MALLLDRLLAWTPGSGEVSRHSSANPHDAVPAVPTSSHDDNDDNGNSSNDDEETSTQRQVPVPDAGNVNDSSPNGTDATPQADADDGVGNDNSGLSAVQSSSNERATLRRNRLSELEDERVHRRSYNSSCRCLAFFFVVQMWSGALAEDDVGLLLLALIGTGWMARWIETQSEAEYEIDREIEELMMRADGDTSTERDEPLSTSTSALAQTSAGMETGDLSVESFQAQLALTIAELGDAVRSSHRSIQERAGLDDEARSRWSTYTHHRGRRDQNSVGAASTRSSGEGHPRGTKRFGLISGKRGGYGSIPSLESGGDVDLEAGGQQQPLAESTPVIPSSSSSLHHHSLGGSSDRSSSELQKGGVDDDGEHHPKDAACSICLCEYEEGETLSKLPCGHIYHNGCITPWVERHVRCPLCNFDLRQEHQLELEARVSDMV